jgi:hypothetical protein
MKITSFRSLLNKNVVSGEGLPVGIVHNSASPQTVRRWDAPSGDWETEGVYPATLVIEVMSGELAGKILKMACYTEIPQGKYALRINETFDPKWYQMDLIPLG